MVDARGGENLGLGSSSTARARARGGVDGARDGGARDVGVGGIIYAARGRRWGGWDRDGGWIGVMSTTRARCGERGD